ncbi:FAD-dependent oxidoreductase [Thalassospira lucentensis]|uniref:FAD-dependent oxidoreductase n=1 Tax=Thalassospira lucentensis TaxID=168935 RepID=UPI003AA8776D
MTAELPDLNYQLTVIGAGPAGMTAAIEAARLGLKVAVFDMQPTPGGQIYKNLEYNSALRAHHGKVFGDSYFEGLSLISEFRRSKIDYFPLSTVWHLRADGAVGVTVKNTTHMIRAEHVLVATGAMERPTPFPGWTIPGVMGAGAAQTLLKSSHAIPSGATAIAGSGPLAILVAYQFLQMGLDLRGLFLTSKPAMRPAGIPAILKAWPERNEVFKGMNWLISLSRRVPVYWGIDRLSATGRDSIEAVSFHAREVEHRIPVQTLLVHDGIIPLFELLADAGCRFDWFEADSYWKPRTNEWGQTTCPGIFAAGDVQGIGGAKAARVRGAMAALEIATLTKKISQQERDALARSMRNRLGRHLSLRPLMLSQFPSGLGARLPSDDTIVCRCEEVTAQTIRETQHAGASTINQMKAVTRCGMGPCQGKMCASTASRIMASSDISGAMHVGSYRARFPGRPLSLGQLARMEISPDFLHNRLSDPEIDKPQLSELAR